MNELRNGLNTRLESKNNYQDKTNYLANRNYEEQTIIKPLNQDNYVNFENYNKSFNKSLEDNFSDDYNNYSINNENNNMNNNKIKNINKDIIYSKNLNQKSENITNSNIKKNYNEIVNSRLEINNLSKDEKIKKGFETTKNVKKKNVRFSEDTISDSYIRNEKNNRNNMQSDIYKNNNYGNNIHNPSKNGIGIQSKIPKNNKDFHEKSLLSIKKEILSSGKENYLNIKNVKMDLEDIDKINMKTNENIYNTEKNMKNINNQNKEKLINILLVVLEKRNIKVKLEDIELFIDRYNLSYSNPEPNLLIQMITDFKQISNKNNEEYETNNLLNNISNYKNSEINEVIYNEFLISIDSRDRNISKFNNPNEFKIDFTPNNLQTESLNGYISTKFENVISVQLISAIFPKVILDGNSLEDYPYIILEIDELGSSYKSTNNNSSKAFAQLTFDIDMGKFKKLVARSDTEYKKNFNHGITLDSFTLRIKTPNGELYNFGPNKNIDNNIKIDEDSKLDEKDEIKDLSYDPNNLNFYKNINDIENVKKNIDSESDNNNNNDNYFPINFVFKIISGQKRLDNMFIKNIE